MIEQLLGSLDVGINGFYVERVPMTIPPNAPEPIAQTLTGLLNILKSQGREPERVLTRTLHSQYDEQGHQVETVNFDLEQDESAGTQRLFALAAPIIRALRSGSLMIIDELDARIHPNLVIELIRLFHNPATNPQHAQLIFTTHNTNLLSANLFRRDQIWFVEKSRQGASELYSLLEYRIDGKIIRNDASFAKDYILGRYGAIPYIGDLKQFLGARDEQITP